MPLPSSLRKEGSEGGLGGTLDNSNNLLIFKTSTTTKRLSSFENKSALTTDQIKLSIFTAKNLLSDIVKVCFG